MSDPRQQALAEATRWLDTARRRSLTAIECHALVEAVGHAPGLLRPTVQALSCQRDAAAVDAILALPPTVPGAVEALYAAFHGGVVRQWPDGSRAPALLALDFRRSRSAAFTEVLARARQVFGEGLEWLSVDGREVHRIVLDARRGTIAGRAAAAALDLQWLHGRLAKLRGTRLWLNGWCFDEHGSVRPAVQAHLVRAWLGWAARQTATAVP